MENVKDPLVCGPCQVTISNFASDIDAENFPDHIIKDAREFEENAPIVISSLSVRLIKDPEIETLCNDFELNQNNGTGNSKGQREDDIIETEPMVEDDPDR